jgi:hypothetical protein
VDWLRVLYRAARELYIHCQAERERLEHLLPGEDLDAALGDPARRIEDARAREAAMRRASLGLVRHINAPERAPEI